MPKPQDLKNIATKAQDTATQKASDAEIAARKARNDAQAILELEICAKAAAAALELLPTLADSFDQKHGKAALQTVIRRAASSGATVEMGGSIHGATLSQVAEITAAQAHREALLESLAEQLVANSWRGIDQWRAQYPGLIEKYGIELPKRPKNFRQFIHGAVGGS